jgi:MerR family transcriptional regulator, light-induced transcriptional regulator
VSDPVEPTGELLTLQDAAERLKVHYMTAYRWVRRGDLPAFKAGGRLRVRVEDVERFVQQRRVDVVLPAAGGRTDWPTHVDRLYDHLAAGLALDANHLVRKVIADGAPAGQVYLELLTPVLHRVGDEWAAGRLTVADEHRASEICNAIISRLSESFRRRGPARGIAVTLTPAHEHHGIPAAMAADFLRAGGYDVHHLGVNVPMNDLRLFLQVVQCDVLCASLTTAGLPPDVYTELTTVAAETCGPVVVVGGQCADPPLAQAAGAAYVRDMVDLVTRVEELRS